MANNSVTFRYRNPAYELISDVTIMKPGFKNIPSSEKLLTRALWDTGSDGCMIDETAASVRGLDEGYSVLIGMDIINKGGFAVTQNQNGGTTMSFTMPCLREIDFQSE